MKADQVIDSGRLQAPRERTRPEPIRSPGISDARPWAVLSVLCIAVLVVNIDMTILNVALPTLVRKLHATSSGLQWIVDAYAIGFGGLLLVAGSLADRLGRKRMLLAGFCTFAVGSLGAALSGSVGVLIAWRAVMGVGAAMTIPAGLSTLDNVFPDPGERARAIGVWGGDDGRGDRARPARRRAVALEVLVGFGVPRQRAAADRRRGRRAATRARISQSRSRPPGPGRRSALDRRDGTAPVGNHRSPHPGLDLGDRRAGRKRRGCRFWPRSSAGNGVVDHPMLRLRFFESRSFSAAIGALLLGLFALAGSLFVITQILQFDLGFSPLQAGVRILPMAALIAIAAPLSTLIARVAGTKATAAAGLAAIAGGLWWGADSSTVSATYSDVLRGMLLAGFGAGLLLPTAANSVLGSIPRAEAGIGSGTYGVAIQIGSALGVAVIGSALSTRYQNHLTSALAAAPGARARAAHDHRVARRRARGRLRGRRPPGRAAGTRGTRRVHERRAVSLGFGALAAGVAALLVLAALPSRIESDDERSPRPGA